MKGNVIGFDPDSNTGAISGYDGKRYDFAAVDWHGQNRPKHGDLVDFIPEGERAAQVYLIEPEYVEPSFGQFYFSLKGRVSRSQYWLKFFLPVLGITVILNILAVAGSEAFNILHSIFQLVVLWPGIAMLVKRIHDRDKPGALVWLLYGPLILAIFLTIAALIAAFADSTGGASALGIISAMLWIAVVVVGIWFLIEFGCMRGTIGPNRYGPDPVSAR